MGIRLPGRAVTSRFYGETEELLERYAWYMTNSKGEEMLSGGSLKPNDLGLFDMLGNALEWCQDRFGLYKPGFGDTASADDEDKRDIKDIKYSDKSNLRLLRGGSFYYRASFVRSAVRFRNAPTDRSFIIGFRPARTFIL
jgi:formylglycine-generating enzyme required for sulfatase activity